MNVKEWPGRARYNPSGQVEWTRFIPWLILPFGAAAVLAEVLFWLFRLGHYYIGIMPALAALIVAGFLKLAIHKAHCRSPLVAAVAGVFAGVILYLGYYYCGMLYHLGPEVRGRFNLLPEYIRFRIHVDRVRDVGASKDESVKPGSEYLNWALFGFESLLVLGFTTGAALKGARKPFCESCQKWLLRQVTHLDPADCPSLIEAFRTSSTRSLASICARPAFPTVPNTMLALDFCPSLQEGRSRDCPAYISLKNVTKAGGSSLLDAFDSAPGKVVLRALRLNPDELPALAPRFEILASNSGAVSVPVLSDEREGGVTESIIEVPAMEIQPVPGDYAGKVLTRKNALIGNAYSLAALLVLFAALALAAWGGITAFPDEKTSTPVAPAAKTLGIAALALGGSIFVGVAVFFLVNPSYLGNRYLLKVTKRQFAQRTGCFVDANNPEALFVEVVPKLNWGRLSLETASDVGFLRVDKTRKEVLFEGDKERWRIPASAITSCDVEYFVEGRGSHAATKLYYTVLRARHPRKFWEAPIRERTGTGIFRSARRKRLAEKLCAAIRDLQPHGAEVAR